MLFCRKNRDKREYKLRIPKEDLIDFANKRISEIQKKFGADQTFRKYFGIDDYSDRGLNSVYIQFSLVSPRNPLFKINITEWTIKKKYSKWHEGMEEKEIHPLYEEIEALEEMCLAFYKK